MLIHFLVGGRGWIAKSLAAQVISAEQVLLVAGRGKPNYYCMYSDIDLSLESSPAMLLASLVEALDSYSTSKIAVTLNAYTVPVVEDGLNQTRYEVVFEEFLRLLFNYLDENEEYQKLAVSVVVISSVFGQRSPHPQNYNRNTPSPPPPSYGAAKAYLDQLMRFYAVNKSTCNPERRFNSLALGFMLKPNSLANDSFSSTFSLRIPVRRFGIPEDAGNALAFLHSDASSFINGACLVCDGGSSCLI